MYYIYHLTDPRKNNTPFYVGYSEHRKNGTNRYDEHLHEAINYDKIKHHKNQHYNKMKIGVMRKILNAGLDIGFVIVHEYDTSALAIQAEIAEIAKYGRRDNNTGVLTNMTDGGEGAGTRVITEDEKARRLASRIRNGTLNHSTETIAKMKKTHTGKTMPGPAWNKGKTKESNTSVAKIAASNTGKKASEETKAKLSVLRMGENNPFYGKKHSQLTIDLMSANSKGKTSGKRNGMYGKSAVKGRKWYVNENNVKLYVFVDDEQLLDNGPWVNGRKWKE